MTQESQTDKEAGQVNTHHNLILPNVIIAGAPKCGTSSLFFWIKAHPDVCGSRLKETFFFHDLVLDRYNKNANVHKHSIEKYAEFFKHYNHEKVIVEATAQYIYQDSAIRHFSRFTPQPKILFLARDPARRAYSQFRFNRDRLGNVPPDMTFREYLGVQEGAGKHKDPILKSRYIDFIDKWLQAFDEDNIIVLQAEKMYADKVGFMKDLATRLGIDPLFYDDFDFFKRNETRKMKSTSLHRLGLRIQPYVPQWIQEKLIIPLYLKLNSSGMDAPTEEDQQVLKDLSTRFKEKKRIACDALPQYRS